MKPSRLKGSDFRLATLKLLENENLVKFFKLKGISTETLRLLMVGVDQEGNVIVPILDALNSHKGTLTIKNIYDDDGGIYVFDNYGLVGNPRSAEKSVTIAKNLIDVLLLWQMGVDNPVMVSDRDRKPYLHAYKTFTFVDKDDELADEVMGAIFTYGIKDLVNYVAMKKELPKVERLEVKERRYEIKKNPFYINEKLHCYINSKGLMMNEDGEYKKTNRMEGYMRTFKKDDEKIVYRGAAWWIPASYKIGRREPMKKLYEDLFTMIYPRLFFMSEDQVVLITLFIIYQWTQAHKNTSVTHLHIINPSSYQVNKTIETLRTFMPVGKPTSEGPSIHSRDASPFIFYKYPCIYVDTCSHGFSYDIGPKILINDESSKLRTKEMKMVGVNRMREMRRRLWTAFWKSKRPPVTQIPTSLYDYIRPFHQAGINCGMTEKEIKNAFSKVCLPAQRLFRSMDVKEYVRNHATKLEDSMFEDLIGSPSEKECK